MPNYTTQAAREVDSMINAGHKLNAQARSQAISEYAQHLRDLDSANTDAKGSLEAKATTDDAKMANRLAARGLSGNGGDQFNYGRLDAQHQSDLGSLLKQFLSQRASMLLDQQKTVGGIDAQDMALKAQRTSKVAELARLLEDRAFQKQQAEAALSMQREQLQMAKDAAALAASDRARALRDGKDPWGDRFLSLIGEATADTDPNTAGIQRSMYPSMAISQLGAMGVDLYAAAMNPRDKHYKVALEALKSLYPKSWQYELEKRYNPGVAVHGAASSASALSSLIGAGTSFKYNPNIHAGASVKASYNPNPFANLPPISWSGY